jgi:hypothetical protein
MRFVKPALTAIVVFPWAGVLAFASCARTSCQPDRTPDAAIEASAEAAVDATFSSTQARVENRTRSTVSVYASFGSDSVVGPQNWPFCATLDAGGCTFSLAPSAGQDLPTGGSYLNVTLSFNEAAGCQVSLGELNIGNPAWSQDTANISLVNGWNADIEIDVKTDGATTTLGPTKGPVHNEAAFGVYPNGCDICVAKQQPPCGIEPCGSPDGSPASCGCKAGTQYNPTVPCQYSFQRGSNATVALVGYGIPASKKR